jgi:hypothetical protein
MGASPAGVAMGVSGSAHLAVGLCFGQVPFTGATHVTYHATAPSSSQHTCPAAQHMVPQQPPPTQPPEGQGARAQLPFMQMSGALNDSQLVLHVPQLYGSFARSTQVAPQHV